MVFIDDNIGQRLHLLVVCFVLFFEDTLFCLDNTELTIYHNSAFTGFLQVGASSDGHIMALDCHLYADAGCAMDGSDLVSTRQFSPSEIKYVFFEFHMH